MSSKIRMNRSVSYSLRTPFNLDQMFLRLKQEILIREEVFNACSRKYLRSVRQLWTQLNHSLRYFRDVDQLRFR